ncbi:MAG: hypothetical protein ACTSSH_09820 [Candidatus Heimdallarchaeota archaeon]
MSKKRTNSEPEKFEPPRSKALLYFAFALAALGAVLMVIPTILIFMPDIELTWTTVFTLPHTYVALAGSVILTIGLILHRKITPPMDKIETEKLRSRLE